MTDKILTILLILAMTLAACHKDDDNEDDDSNIAPPQHSMSKVQIMTVFAPGQLGDQGYADLVMKGINALSIDSTINADIEFMTSTDIETLQKTILTWATENTTSRDGTPYSRRLLVMTELYMAKWFAAITSALREGDEVLLLKASESDIKTAAQILGERIPVYGINISAASAVREYVQVYLDILEICNQQLHPHNIGYYRLYSQETGLYRDSVAEAIQEVLQLPAPPVAKNILTQEGELYNTDMAGTSFEQAYMMCATELLKRAKDDLFDIFSIIDFGSSNSGATFYLMGNNSNYDIFPLLLDSQPRWHSKSFSIVRHFDRAIDTWVRNWLKQEPSTMPSIENHGGWDGYCEIDIDYIEIVLKLSDRYEQSGNEYDEDYEQD